MLEALQLCPLSEFLESQLTERFKVHRWFELTDREQFLAQHAPTIRAVVTGGHIGIPNALLSQLPAVGIVSINGVGFDKVDLEECKRRGVRVSTTPNVLTDDVADLAVGLIIGLLRGIPAADKYVRDGKWPGGDRPLARKVSGRRFGIVGLGNIGRAIASRLAPFGPVAYCDVIEKKDSPYSYFTSTLELAKHSDVLVLATTANSSTHRLIGREALDALGPQGYVVNIARGSLVDETELVAALAERRIAGAALDVFADEPNVPQALRDNPKVVLTPHIASATVETREAMARSVLSNLDAFFRGEPLSGGLV